jgi:hypothetical protein
MYKAISVVVLAVGLSGATHVAQSPSDDRRLISRQSVKLTAEQEYVIRENVKEVRSVQPVQNVTPKVDDKIPSDVELDDFPSLVIDKIPHVKAFKFRHGGSDSARIATEDRCRCDQETLADRLAAQRQRYSMSAIGTKQT